MNNNKKINAILIVAGVLIICSTIVVIDNQEKQQAERRQAAFVAIDKLQNDPSITVAQAEEFATLIHLAVESRAVVSYRELGAGSYFTIEEMVEHVKWGCQMKWVDGN